MERQAQERGQILGTKGSMCVPGPCCGQTSCLQEVGMAGFFIPDRKWQESVLNVSSKLSNGKALTLLKNNYNSNDNLHCDF